MLVRSKHASPKHLPKSDCHKVTERGFGGIVLLKHCFSKGSNVNKISNEQPLKKYKQEEKKCKYVRKGNIKSNFFLFQSSPITSEKDIRQILLKNNPLFSYGKHFTPHMVEAINLIDSSKAIYN